MILSKESKIMLLKFFKNNWIFTKDFTLHIPDLYIKKDGLEINFYSDFMYYKRSFSDPKSLVQISYKEILKIIKNGGL